MSSSGNKLSGGILIGHKSEKVLFLPPGTLHAVWTKKGAFFLGGEISLVEGLEVMARFIRSQLMVVETSKEMLKQDIEKYAEAIGETLRLRRDVSTILAIQSWLNILPNLNETLERLKPEDGRRELCKWIGPLVSEWQKWAGSNPHIKCCPCKPTKALDSFGIHFKRSHIPAL